MTDKERLIALLDSFHLKLVEGNTWQQPELHSYRVPPDVNTVILHEGRGYSQFECMFHFDPDGKFVYHEVYE